MKRFLPISRRCIVFTLVGIGGLLAAATVDWEWTMFLHERIPGAFGEIMGRSAFEGELPGAGDPVVVYLITAVFVYIAALRAAPDSPLAAARPSAGFVVAASLIASVIFVHGAKWAMGRARPDLVLSNQMPFSHWFVFGPHLISEGTYNGSFPSGHTAQAFTPFAMVYVLLGARKRLPSRRWWGILLACLCLAYVTAMGVARCVTLSHWITDVLGSMLFSALIMHLLFFHIMRVPAQQRYFAACARHPEGSTGWELWFILYTALAVCGVALMVVGARVLSVPDHRWLSAWVLPGVILTMVGLVKCRSLCRRIHAALEN
jgi:membrane-associated phospholipid phosphatase